MERLALACLVALCGVCLGQPPSPRIAITEWRGTNGQQWLQIYETTPGPSGDPPRLAGAIHRGNGAHILLHPAYDYGTATFSARFMADGQSNSLAIRYLRTKGTNAVLTIWDSNQVKFTVNYQ